jgi:cell division protease FtsH
MAATNRKEVLDPALVRPGRFDRIIKLELPDTAGREKILRVHASKLPGFKEGSGIDDSRSGSLGKGRAVDLSAVASATPGLSGAELEFIVNEAAIRAVRRVSAELQQGMDPAKIVPTVEAIDFEESVKNFFQTRRTKGGVSDLLRSLQK